jgi:4-diphosphocytidyl-2-C-methyl-D-erythritol kinase
MISASAPGKLNLYFGVGALETSGFHDVISLYQAVDVWETVTVEPAADWGVGVSGRIAAEQLPMIPTDRTNLVVRAALTLADYLDFADPQPIRFQILKRIPVSAGLAGGSADAAAALLATDALWCSGVDEAVLADCAAKVGSDVPFALLGGTALGTGRGEKLEPLTSNTKTHWVLIPDFEGLSTPAVYRKLDDLRREAGADPLQFHAPTRPSELIAALQSGDLRSVAEHMHNDLELAAIALKPTLANTIAKAEELGALRAMVSGSGPTVAALCEDADAANRVAAEFIGAIVTSSTSEGSYLELGC